MDDNGLRYVHQGTILVYYESAKGERKWRQMHGSINIFPGSFDLGDGRVRRRPRLPQINIHLPEIDKRDALTLRANKYRVLIIRLDRATSRFTFNLLENPQGVLEDYLMRGNNFIFITNQTIASILPDPQGSSEHPIYTSVQEFDECYFYSEEGSVSLSCVFSLPLSSTD